MRRASRSFSGSSARLLGLGGKFAGFEQGDFERDAAVDLFVGIGGFWAQGLRRSDAASGKKVFADASGREHRQDARGAVFAQSLIGAFVSFSVGVAGDFNLDGAARRRRQRDES